ncbi:hypothetical protein [Enterococcus sp. BWR-S5]|uniref:hypothetical protein n=1 Tax=Enterococcus sp. BWR-S5 TaxID=2787714 RepID=UPI00192401E1|nr:hypothetical protein [Enterococcus sp. BWR-S5]MBL1226465.1 hypothetical protein [Enterococcus sp. BWR-S5]
MFGWFKQEKKANKHENEAKVSQPSYTITQPTPFGYKSVWIAVHSESALEVAEAVKALGFDNFQVNESYNGWVFVHDVIDSVTDFSKVTAINDEAEDSSSYWALLIKSNCVDEKNIAVLKELSKAFGSVCFFVNHRVSDCYAWVKCETGEVTRAFEFIEGYGVTIDMGIPTEEEDNLSIDYGDFNAMNEADEEDNDSPNENDVMEIAVAWSSLPAQ